MQGCVGDGVFVMLFDDAVCDDVFDVACDVVCDVCLMVWMVVTLVLRWNDFGFGDGRTD